MALEIEGHRSDLTLMKAARAYCAFCGRNEVELDDIKAIAPFVYLHRMRSLPFERAREFDPGIIGEILGEKEGASL